MSAPKNPPAFPSVCLNDPCHEASVPGMTLRDWFAGQALKECIAQYQGTEDAAEVAYNYADAMLAQRSLTKAGEA